MAGEAVTRVLRGAEFDAKHTRGHGGRFAAGITRPKLLKRDERAVAAVGENFHPADLSTFGHAAAVARAHPSRVHPDAVGSFHDIAKALRSGKPDERAKTLDAAMAPTTHDLVVTRHLGSGAFGLRGDRLADLPEMLRGRKIIDRSYTPAALHQAPQGGGVTLHIAVPKGTRAVAAGDNEIWLDRNTELAVSGVYRNGHGGYTVEVTALPKAATPTVRKATKAAPTKAARKAASPAKKAAPPAAPPTPAKRTAKKAAPKKATPAKTAPPAPAGSSFPSRSADKLGDLMRSDSYERIDSQVKRAIGGTYGGLRADVTGVGNDNGEIGVEGIISDPATGEAVGEFQRYYLHDDAGKLVASHQFLQLHPDVQGSGFAREFNANLFDWYRRSGFDRVEVHADIDVGGYTWATQGFDFKNDAALNEWLGDARREMDIHLGRRTTQDAKGARELGAKTRLEKAFQGVPKLEVDRQLKEMDQLLAAVATGRQASAYEISQLGRKRGQGRDDMWIGKFLMLGSDWLGALRL